MGRCSRSVLRARRASEWQKDQTIGAVTRKQPTEKWRAPTARGQIDPSTVQSMQAKNQLLGTGYRSILCTLAQARPEGLVAVKEGLTARMLVSDGTLRTMLQISSQSLPLRTTKNAVSTTVPAAL